jgi:hypothetical protein
VAAVTEELLRQKLERVMIPKIDITPVAAVFAGEGS